MKIGISILIIVAALLMLRSYLIAEGTQAKSEGVLKPVYPDGDLKEAIRKYTNLLLKMAKRGSDGSLTLFGSDDSPEKMAKRIKGNGADQEELEMLKRAWKRHKREKREENPGGRDSESRDPLEKLESLMKGIERGLSREDPGQGTQEKQREAIDLLDELIRQLTPPERDPSGGSEKEQKPDSGSSGKKPGRLVDPSRSNRPAEPGAKAKGEALKKAREKDKPLTYGPAGTPPGWDGKLPGRRKLEDLEPGMDEKRPPKYRRLIESYFRKLLEGLSGR